MLESSVISSWYSYTVAIHTIEYLLSQYDKHYVDLTMLAGLNVFSLLHT